MDAFRIPRLGMLGLLVDNIPRLVVRPRLSLSLSLSLSAWTPPVIWAVEPSRLCVVGRCARVGTCLSGLSLPDFLLPSSFPLAVVLPLVSCELAEIPCFHCSFFQAWAVSRRRVFLRGGHGMVAFVVVS